MNRILLAATLGLAAMAWTLPAGAQGTVKGAQRGADDGARAAGPVGAVVGGAVGAATGTVGGVLGTDPDARDQRQEETRQPARKRQPH